MTSYKVELRNIDDIKPYENNPRINDSAVDAVAASLQEFGFRQPIVIDADGIIVCGHTRWKAAKKLGLAKVPVHIATDLTPEQVRAYRLADNKTGEIATWDMDILPIELAELQDGGFDLSLLAFDEQELGRLLNDAVDVKEGLTAPDAVPETPDECEVQLGDVWLLGEHRLMCGDSTKADDIERLMDGEKAEMVFADPPYGMSYGGGRAVGDNVINKKTGGVLIKAHGMIANDDLAGDELIALVRDSIANATAYLDADGAVYVCLTWRTYAEFESALEAAGRKVEACIVWDKQSIGLGHARYRPQHEFLFYCGGKWYGDRAESDVWHMSRGNTAEYLHPTQKPVELVRRALGNSSTRGGIVLDPFSGSGTVLIASEQFGRKCRTMELSPEYCQTAIKRWEEFTGCKAERIATAECPAE